MKEFAEALIDRLIVLARDPLHDKIAEQRQTITDLQQMISQLQRDVADYDKRLSMKTAEGREGEALLRGRDATINRLRAEASRAETPIRNLYNAAKAATAIWSEPGLPRKRRDAATAALQAALVAARDHVDLIPF